MTIRYSENPKSAASMDYKSPASKREYVFRGSDNETEILLAVAQAAPLFDTGVDATTFTPITLFRGKIDIKAAGTSVWSVIVEYGGSPQTIEISFSIGVQNVKIQQALKDVASYSCLQAVSAATTTAAAAANTAATALQSALSFGTDTFNLNQAIITAANAAAVGGVDATVFLDVMNCVTACNSLVTDGLQIIPLLTNEFLAVDNASSAATAGNSPDATNYAANALNYYNQAATLTADANTQSANAIVLALLATSDASGKNAQTIAAAAAATTMAAYAGTVYSDLAAATADGLTASNDATAVATACAASFAPGGNGVPDFKGAIGVDATGKVEGVDIEVGKISFTVTKKWQKAVLPADYLIVLAQMTSRTVVNDQLYVISWMGQLLSFPRGSLRFRGAALKWSAQGDLEIMLDFAYERPILLSDNFRIGNSAYIVKEGWQYLWVRYAGTISSGIPIAQPADVHIVDVYPHDDFSKIRL